MNWLENSSEAGSTVHQVVSYFQGMGNEVQILNMGRSFLCLH